MTRESLAKSDRQIARGRSLDYVERIGGLFLREVEETMYIKWEVANLRCGDLEDIVITTQGPWYMYVAKEHGIWFPSGVLVHGLRPTKYVAYYETRTEGNENPGGIAYIAQNLIYWNRITLADAKQVPEIQALFSDHRVRAEIDTWKENETRHIALTKAPTKLRNPIPLGKGNYARILSKRRYSLAHLLNARTVDDLFGG